MSSLYFLHPPSQTQLALRYFLLRLHISLAQQLHYKPLVQFSLSEALFKGALHLPSSEILLQTCLFTSSSPKIWLQKHHSNVTTANHNINDCLNSAHFPQVYFVRLFSINFWVYRRFPKFIFQIDLLICGARMFILAHATYVSHLPIKRCTERG